MASVGETLAFVIYFIKKRWFAGDQQQRILKKQTGLNADEDLSMLQSEEEAPAKIKPWLFAIPAWLDMTESVLKNIATTMIAASIVQMLRSTVFIYCALLALFFLHKRLYRQHWASMATIGLGVGMVGLAYFLYKKENKDYSATDQLVGFILLQVGQLFGAFAFVAEEKFLGDCDTLDPLVVVGFEGVWGLLAWAVLLPIFQFVPCSFDSVCTNGIIEDTAGVFRDYAANPVHIAYSLSLILLVTALNVCGVSVTKYGSSAQRTTCDIMRNLFVWIFFMSVSINGQPPKEQFNFLQLAGFVVVTAGVLVYNEIVVLPFWGFGDKTRVKLEQRDRMQISIDHVDRPVARYEALDEDKKPLY